MTIILAIAVHVLSAVVWVGGMFFAYVCLRPSVPGIEPPPERLKLWCRVFTRFFTWVWVAIVCLLASAYWMVLSHFGGHGGVGLHVHYMEGAGWLMMGIFAFLYFKVWPAFRTAVTEGNMPLGVEKLAIIRKIVATNLAIGVVTIVIGATGRYWG